MKLTFPILTLFLFISLTSPYSFANSRVSFDISYDRSNNIDITNKIKSLSEIGDSVTINSKGRLWLIGNETREGFHEILCQNLTSTPITILINSIQLPWIKVSEPAKCNSWSNSLLVCANDSTERAVFCKIKQRLMTESISNESKKKKTSVAVRSLSSSLQQDKPIDYEKTVELTIKDYSAGIELCEDIYSKQSEVILEWTIFDGGTTGDMKFDSSKVPSSDLGFVQCVAKNIEQWHFPRWKKNFRIKYKF